MRDFRRVAPVVIAMVLVASPVAAEIVINELMIETGSTGEILADGMFQWVELYNTGPDEYVGGWTLSDRDAIARASLPIWNVPSKCYLTVHFGEGDEDDDFSDGEGHYYVGAATECFDIENDECGLYTGVPSLSTIVDFVAWGHVADYTPGIAGAFAVVAGIWTGSEYVATDTLGPVDHMSRAFDGLDTDVPGDFIVNERHSMFQYGRRQPSNPIQVSPVDCRMITETMPTFVWHAVESVDSYRLQVYPDTSSGTPEIDVDGLQDPEYTAEFPLAGNVYSWRVSGEVMGQQTAWSPEWRIFVDDGSWPISDQGGFGAAACPHLFQRKDSKLLCISLEFRRPGCPENTPDCWDSPHPDSLHNIQRWTHGCNYCVRASIAMINHHLGGDLTQDRISFFLFNEWQDRVVGPEFDLGCAQGCWPPDSNSHEEDALSWALDSVSIDVRAKPSGQTFPFDSIKTWIDQLDCFMTRYPGHMLVVDAYSEFTQGDKSNKIVYVNDPNDLPHVPYIYSYQLSLGGVVFQGKSPNFVHAFLHPVGWNLARSLEPSCTTDTDGDGVMDFDEDYRFLTNTTSQDSDSDGVNDKQDIRSYVFHSTDHPTCPVLAAPFLVFPDIDGDSLRAELDFDTDGDTLSDGAEDLDGDGISPETGETCVFDAFNVPPPTIGLVIVVDEDRNATLNWSPVADAFAYSIFGSSLPDDEGVLLDVVGDTTWTDYDAVSTRDSPYFYHLQIELTE